MATREHAHAVQMPWMLGLIATRSTDTEVPGISSWSAGAKQRIINGIPAYTALRALRKNPDDPRPGKH